MLTAADAATVLAYEETPSPSRSNPPTSPPSSPTAPRRFPGHGDLSTITAIDLLGTGTACLVWSSALPGQGHAPMRYIDLLGRKKPYLLESITNNCDTPVVLRSRGHDSVLLQVAR